MDPQSPEAGVEAFPSPFESPGFPTLSSLIEENITGCPTVPFVLKPPSTNILLPLL